MHECTAATISKKHVHVNEKFGAGKKAAGLFKYM